MDKQMLRVALSHLLRNALEATLPGGTVLVRTSLEHDAAMLTIKDTGKGMAPEVVSKVFIPFYTTKIGGTGLGMVLVHQIVDEHRGTIHLESELGQGTMVTINLPLRFSEFPEVSEDTPNSESPDRPPASRKWSSQATTR